jgi:carboxymethylenebutenolidase
MPTEPFSLLTAHGVMDTHLTTPEHGGPWPAIILYMDAMGVRPALIGMAERLASHGYAVILPNLYYRHGALPAVDTQAYGLGGAERERVFALMHSLTHAGVMSDTRAMFEFIDRQPSISRGPIGALGYCMGGGFGLTAAGTFPDRVGAVASLHGAGLATDAPDSPHLLADKCRAALYIGVAGIDPLFPDEQRERLEAALTQGGCRFTIEVYPGAKHGFSVTGHPVYDEQASERHWRAVLDLFAREIQRRSPTAGQS